MLFHIGYPWARGGFIGVDVFFVLSGFLITTLLWQEWEKNGFISLKKFYARRALRLLPALVLFLLIVGSLKLMFGAKGTSLYTMKAILASLFYVMNWAAALQWFDLERISEIGHTWSLSTEEQFYMLWPILFLFLLRCKLNRKLMLMILAVGAAIPTALRYILWQEPNSSMRLYFGFDTRADGLLLGCLIGLAASWNLLPKSRLSQVASMTLAICAVVFLVYVSVGGPISRSFPTANSFLYIGGGFTLVNLSIAVILVYLLAATPKSMMAVLEWDVLVWIGQLSYGLYLWHCPVFQGLFTIGFLQSAIDLFSPDMQLNHFALAFTCAVLSYYFVEQPFLRIKQRFSVESRDWKATNPESAADSQTAATEMVTRVIAVSRT
jgi:peptidoglycan/LPS O-acetylase OafA/YrhL